MNNELTKKIDFNNEDQCIELIESGMKLGEIPVYNRTPKICLKAVECDPRNIAKIPHDFKTANICLKAAEKDPSVIKYFPKNKIELFAEDLCLRAIEKDPPALYSFWEIPDEAITEKIFLTAFNKNPWVIKKFPKNLKLDKKELIIKAIKEDIEIFENLDYNERDTEVCLAAFEVDHYSFKYFPVNNPELFKEDIINKAINSYPELIKDIPSHIVTLNFYKSLIRMDTLFYNRKGIIEHISFDIIEKIIEEDINLWEDAVKIINHEYIKYIPINKRSIKLCKDIFEENPLNIMYFPDIPELFEKNMMLRGIVRHPEIIKFIPEKYIDDEIRDAYRKWDYDIKR